MGLRRYITIRKQFEGFHTYKDAPQEVAFLKNNHRHLFKMEATIEVLHDDRELEFFLVQQQLDREIMPFALMMADLGSCEQIAERILNGLRNTYGDNRYYCINISEDGENDGICTYTPA